MRVYVCANLFILLPLPLLAHFHTNSICSRNERMWTLLRIITTINIIITIIVAALTRSRKMTSGNDFSFFHFLSVFARVPRSHPEPPIKFSLKMKL